MQCILRLTFILCLFPFIVHAQKNGIIKGTVSDAKGNPISGMTISVGGTKYKTQSDANGNYEIEIHAGKYQLISSGVGYGKSVAEISIHPGQKITQHFSMKSKEQELQTVQVSGKTAIQEVRESPFNVVTLDAKSMYNSTLDLGHLLDKASGIKIRETGGLGSDLSVSLNGFTGRNVKLFMDGVPMQGFGSAFQLNNIPVNIAERIEIYKGVVPIEFGADAMGGVINIVTNQSANTFLDASYAYGSFNTHKSNISLGHTTKDGFSFQLNAFQNYSDNDYKVKTTVLMPNGNYSLDEYWVRRFHDTYHNETVMAKIGFVNKSWADHFFVGVTVGQEQADIQNSTLLKFVYGERSRSGHTLLPSLSYDKRNLFVKGLNVRLSANYNRNSNQNIDTASRRYNWFGEVIPTRTRGEVGTNTLSDYVNNNASSTANISYRINDKHSISANDVITGYQRKLSSDVVLAEEASAMDTMKRSSLKNVFGISYRYNPSRNWNANLFAKNYYQKATGPFNTSSATSQATYEERSENYSTTGYGLAITYFYKDIQFKSSVERAYRLPTDNELFGDEVLETGNSTLRAENSMNFNLGASMNKQLKNGNVWYVDLNTYYRDTKDFIRRVQEARFGTTGNINHGKVSTVGADAEVRFYYKNKAMIGGTVTYMDMRNREPLRTGTGTALSGTYNDRMPNIPYFFGNLDVAYYLHNLAGKGNVLNLNYTFNYVGEYYLLWESQGNANTKSTLPQQIYHDFSATYMMKNGRYNIALEARNFSNSLLYDNFSLQKPGRSFHIKLRYYLMKRG